MSRAAWSKAERSLQGGQIRRFDADEIVAFARVFSVPISHFFSPPDPHFKGKRVVVNGKPGNPRARVTAPPITRDQMMRLAARALMPTGPLDQAAIIKVLAEHQEKATRQAVKAFLHDHPERMKEIASGGRPIEVLEYFQTATGISAVDEDKFAQEMLAKPKRKR